MDSKNKSNFGIVAGLAIGAALGGLLFGYDTAVISGAVEAIDHNFIDPIQGLSEIERNSKSGSAIGIALWGCVAGSLIAGPIANKLGRKVGMTIAAFVFLFSSILSGFPELGLGEIGKMGPGALPLFMAYRFLGGVAIGMASLISPMYISEIAPAKSRGLLITFQQIAIVGGMLLVYFVNLLIARQGDDAWVLSIGWRYMLASAAIPSLLFILASLLMPDTPRWYVLKGREDEALTVLHKINDEEEVEPTFNEIKASLSHKEAPLFSFGKTVLIVGVLLSVFQQFVGINAVLYYAPLMFKNIGSGTDTALLQTLIVGIANVLFTIVALFTVDKWGRKPLLILGAVMMAVSMAALGLLFQTKQEGTMLLIFAVFYIAGFALSWGPVVWVLLAEMFPNSIKGSAMSLAVAAQWVSNWIVTWSFKVIDGSSAINTVFNHGFTYYCYAGLSVLAAVFVWKMVPETKGKTLESIELLWKKSV